MKKALIVLLILAVAGGVFAQSFSGSVRTGALFSFDGEDNPVKAYDDDNWRHHGIEADLNFSNGGDDWGFSFNTRGTVDDGDVGGLFLDGFNGWVKFADMFKLTAGRDVGDAWYPGSIFDWEAMGDSAANFRLEITPIDGLNFGFLFGFPNWGSSADKLVDFFGRTGIGVNYDAGILSAWTTLQFEPGTDLDATWKFGAGIPVAGLFNVDIFGKIAKLLSDQEIQLEEKISGNIVGLGWYVQAREKFGDKLAVTLRAHLDYGIPVNDKASAEVGATAQVDNMDNVGLDQVNAYAKLNYSFNGNASTLFELGANKGYDLRGFGYDDITPYFLFGVKYSF